MFEKQKKALEDRRNVDFLIVIVGGPLVIFFGLSMMALFGR